MLRHCNAGKTLRFAQHAARANPKRKGPEGLEIRRRAPREKSAASDAPSRNSVGVAVPAVTDFSSTRRPMPGNVPASTDGIGLRPARGEVRPSGRRSAARGAQREYSSTAAGARRARSHPRDYPISLHGVGLSLGPPTRSMPDTSPVERRPAPSRHSFSEHRLGPHRWSHLNDLCRCLSPTGPRGLLRSNRRGQEALASLARRERVRVPPLRPTRCGMGFVPQPPGATAASCCGTSTTSMSCDQTTASIRAAISTRSRRGGSEIHLAGSTPAALVSSTHGTRVVPPVWASTAAASTASRGKQTLIEWDTDLPGLDVLQDEAAIAQAILEEADAVAA